MPACMTVHHVRTWGWRSSEAPQIPLGLQLQTVTSHHAGSGNKTQILERSRRCKSTESSLQSFKTQFFDVKTFWIWNSSWKEYFYLSRHFKHSYMAVDTIQGLAVFTALSPGLETTSQCPCRAAPTRCISSSKGVPHPLLPPNRQLYTWIISFHSHFSWS